MGRRTLQPGKYLLDYNVTRSTRRTMNIRLGKDQLLRRPDGPSRISVRDYALAMVDELENPQHTGHRFTVGY